MCFNHLTYFIFEILFHYCMFLSLSTNLTPVNRRRQVRTAHQGADTFRSESVTGPVASRATGRGTAPPPVRLTPRRAKTIPPDMALREVADKIWKKDWARVANKLGFFSQDVEDIQSAYPNNPQHQVYQMLKQWRERDGEEAYAEVLEQALLDCGMTDAAIVMTSY